MARKSQDNSDFDCKRFRDHMPPLTEEERARLKSEIEREGCRDALVIGIIGERRYLVDGFNRKAICEGLGIEYKTSEMAFGSEEEALLWIEGHAQARRQMKATGRSYYMGRRHRKENKGHGGKRVKVQTLHFEDNDTAERESSGTVFRLRIRLVA